jgi:F-type H+-transporting ATPase subunit b
MEDTMKHKTWLMLVLLIAPAWLFGSEHASAFAEQYHAVAGRYTDFIPRMVNFTIFAALTYYLVASPLKAFFVERKEGIADQLNEIERKLQEAKETRKRAEQALIESKAKAKEIAVDSHKEIELLQTKFAEATERELTLLESQFEEKCEREERRMARETIDAILNENISADDIPMSADKVIEIVAKKVA